MIDQQPDERLTYRPFGYDTAWDAQGKPYDKTARVLPAECDHPTVEADDDGLSGHWFSCTTCHAVLTVEPNEDGGTDWVVLE